MASSSMESFFGVFNTIAYYAFTIITAFMVAPFEYNIVLPIGILLFIVWFYFTGKMFYAAKEDGKGKSKPLIATILLVVIVLVGIMKNM